MFFNTNCGFPFTILPFKNYAKELKKKKKEKEITFIYKWPSD